MGVSLFIEGEVIFFPGHQAFSFVGEIIAVILLADAHHGAGAQVSLLNGMAGEFHVVCGDLIHQIFPFNFHLSYLQILYT